MITTPLAKESGHFYTKTGEPAYSVENKSKPGTMRPTTVRDAKKLGLLPSTTTIIASSAKPGLVHWKMEQVLLAALTSSRNEGEDDRAYMSRIMLDASEQAKRAAERGTQIHGWIEKWLSGAFGQPDEAAPFISLAAKELDPLGVEWEHEKSFAATRYGGKLDLYSLAGIVVDIKTNEKPVAEAKLWEEHLMQLASYRLGVGMPLAQCGILFINHKDMESRLVWAEEEDLVRGWKMFDALVDYYYAKTGL
jgi:hypothetical protein